jgi:hypothetical protein
VRLVRDALTGLDRGLRCVKEGREWVPIQRECSLDDRAVAV